MTLAQLAPVVAELTNQEAATVLLVLLLSVALTALFALLAYIISQS